MNTHGQRQILTKYRIVLVQVIMGLLRLSHRSGLCFGVEFGGIRNALLFLRGGGGFFHLLRFAANAGVFLKVLGPRA